jgi:hypothetical protein
MNSNQIVDARERALHSRRDVTRMIEHARVRIAAVRTPEGTAIPLLEPLAEGAYDAFDRLACSLGFKDFVRPRFVGEPGPVGFRLVRVLELRPGLRVCEFATG